MTDSLLLSYLEQQLGEMLLGSHTGARFCRGTRSPGLSFHEFWVSHPLSFSPCQELGGRGGLFSHPSAPPSFTRGSLVLTHADTEPQSQDAPC